MSEFKLLDGRVIGKNSKPYITAEINACHNGSLETAKKIIDEIKLSNCDCAKIPSFSPKALYCTSYFKENPTAKKFVEKFSFNEEQLTELCEYTKSVGLTFNSTPYSIKEADFLIEKCGVPFIKISSMDINNYSFLKYIANSGMPVVLSTGMADMTEIYEAVEVLEKNGSSNICLLHCVSVYPSEVNTINLKNIVGLKKAFPDYSIGFSDHSLGIEMASAAVALGACYIEKHFTLDKTVVGLEKNMAIEPAEMSALVSSCHNVYFALGSKNRVLTPEEINKRKEMRRSIVFNKDMQKGDVIAKEDLDFKRPGTGVPITIINKLIGKKLLTNVAADTLISIEDIDG